MRTIVVIGLAAIALAGSCEVTIAAGLVAVGLVVAHRVASNSVD